MINYFDKIYQINNNGNWFLSAINYYSFIRLLTRSAVNIIAPIYFFANRRRKEYSVSCSGSQKPMLIVTLTSIPARITRVWLVIETIMRQTMKPDRIILWLSKEQFASKDYLPINLISQLSRGLEIRFVDGDLKSHKKYYYMLKEYSNDIMITIDDDIFYRTNMIEDLYNYSLRYPGNIISQYCKQIMYKDNELMPYTSWPGKHKEKAQSDSLFYGTGGGTLIPACSLHPDVLKDEIFMELTPTADDIWLNSMTKLNKTLITQTSYYSHNLPVLNRNRINLASVNNDKNQNDIQIKAIQQYYIENINTDPFAKP